MAETFSQAPQKTDSLADYNSISEHHSAHLSIDSDFEFDFGNVATRSDGTIKSSASVDDAVAIDDENIENTQQGDHIYKNYLSCNSKKIENENTEILDNIFEEIEPPSLLNKSLTCTLGDVTASGTVNGGREQRPNRLAKFFTRTRIAWWLVSFVLFFAFSPFVAAIVFLMQFMGFQDARKATSKRTIKWIVENFSEEIKAGILTSPPFADKSGQWRVIVLQKECIDGLQTTFGLIVTDLPEEIEHVKATIEFTCVNQLGHELSKGYQSLYFQHSFACAGDCGYSRAIILSPRQLGEHKEIQIKCRVEFERQEIGYLNELYRRFMGVYGKHQIAKRGINAHNASLTNSVPPTFGKISPQKSSDQRSLKDKDNTWCGSPMTKFIKHPETKTFTWEIPNFSKLLKNAECWGLFSPQIFVNSHDFCSIWRLKFFELLGVFRLHVQLRGLPGAIKQVKTWHLVTLQDNYGDHIVPEDCNPRLKYPDYINVWGSHRHILYRRETILDRFVSNDTVTIRISIQVEPNELMWMEGNGSDGWILA